MIRLHRAQLSPNGLTIDGVKMTVHEDVQVETLAPDIHMLSVQIICESIVLNGDTHDLDEPTPIWDQLIAERGNLPDLSTTKGSIK